jgi:hypothetical protein
LNAAHPLGDVFQRVVLDGSARLLVLLAAVIDRDVVADRRQGIEKLVSAATVRVERGLAVGAPRCVAVALSVVAGYGFAPAWRASTRRAPFFGLALVVVDARLLFTAAIHAGLRDIPAIRRCQALDAGFPTDVAEKLLSPAVPIEATA